MRISRVIDQGHMRRFWRTGDIPPPPAPPYKPGVSAVLNSEDISDGMVLSCLFNEGMGTTAADKTPSPTNGTLSTSSLWDSDSTYDSVLQFTGGHVTVPHDAKNNIETYTIAFAFKTSSTFYYGTFIGKGASRYPYLALLGWPSHGQGQVALTIWDGGAGNPSAITDDGFNDGVWHKVVLTREAGGDVNTYIDGVLKATDFDNTSPGGALNTSDVIIGKGAGAGQEYTGQLAYVHMWNRVLTGAPASVDDPATGEIAAIADDEFLMYR